MMIRMESSRTPGPRRSQIEDLESTRVDLIEIYAGLLHKLSEAKSAQWQVATLGFGGASDIRIPGAAAPISPAQLATAIHQFEFEVAHVRRIIERVDARLACVPR
jgi:hypothetical protein